ncbi:pre-mRNA-splicing ATP-dependent RNA helicase PRP28 [Cryptococcus neoformans]|nr:pre-mRNA-splicing ATP-dependent RNA helicase PRP28 [Cryptococcus neoformans var. grubii c45]OXB39508.1 pre-mRNA-splicing ATP-dependent RNA helicase PRP28 [Cryptococcus neoformans var. grubii]OXC65155.1 pre-mRNA-splicing ATP-dependent RNA helicase PRP28 [Cryptococcus neoformans var. grubii MW-RSA852]UOH79646.1 pre-mRNA-splicing ATP-dependent RNA helicase PRP28 [Cryptococcus neoformans]
MAGPLSVEDILAKQKAEKEAAAKPKFLSKAERQKIALEKRQSEVRDQQEREDAERRQREEFDRAAEEERRRYEQERYGYNAGPSGRNDRDGYGRNGYGRDNRRGFGDRRDGPGPAIPSGPRGAALPVGPRSMQSRNGGGLPYDGLAQGSPSQLPSTPVAGSASPASASIAASGDAVPPSQAELEALRARYLGKRTDGKKPRLRKAQDKKIIFDWNEQDDTSAADQNSWTREVRELVPGGTMFGGRLAGMDGAKKNDARTDNHADPLERRRAVKGKDDDRHWSDKPLDEMKERDWRIFREDFSIAARGGGIPHPLRNWRESAIPSQILDIIEEIGYKEPSPIQRQAIPIGMQNRDLIGIAKTGSGKTAAFVIPMLDYIGHLPPLNDDNRHLGPYALIMAPTRELAQQIEAETRKFALPLGYKCVSIVGGRSVEEQQFALRDGAEIIIATPGRLKDMVDKSILVMSQCRYVVMDEADRMVDLGFEVDLNFILDSMPATFVKPDDSVALQPTKEGEWQGWRVTTLFSATMPPAVERLARKYLIKPATVVIGNAGEAVDTVEQRVEFVHGDEKKKARLIEILRTIGLPPPIIVFVNQKKTADMVVKYVQQAGMSGVTLHSGKSQEQREAALQSLRDGEISVLVATDLAGRGIDVPDVSLVINWQMSDTIEKYVHRIGRTGRAGKTGVAITFLTNDDDEVMYDLRVEVEKSKMSKMNPELARHEAARTRVTREMKRKRGDEEE